MSTAGRRERSLTIVTRDAGGRSFAGALIEIMIDGVKQGEVVSSGSSTVSVDFGSTVELTASLGGARVVVEVDADATETMITLPRFRALARAVPTARCPDGTSGQPCVDCVIGGRKVRLCA